MTDLALKYNLLDTSARREVLDFMDFLLSKTSKVKKSVNGDYKRKILKVSVWDDSDVEIIRQNPDERRV
jgi:hypothetical protein